MNRFEEAKRDIDRAIELAGQLRVYFLNLDVPNCMAVLGVMARKAADIDIARGLAYGPGFEEGLDALHWALR